MTAPSEPPRPGLRAVLLRVCDESGPEDDYAVVAADPILLGQHGVSSIVRSAEAEGRLAHTAAQIVQQGMDLRTLILVRVGGSGPAEPCWIADGWKALRTAGFGADLRGADLRGANLRGARLAGADLSEAMLRGADLEKADLAGACLRGTDLSGAHLFSASLAGADLTEAEVCRADLRHADLREALLRRTAMRGADLWGAYTWGVDLSLAFTDGVQLDRADDLDAHVS